MDSRPVKVEGMIENQLVILAKYPDIQITMDILVIDVPDKWGMLLVDEIVIDANMDLQWPHGMSLMPPSLAVYWTPHRVGL